jgi:hypothetical protein
MPNEKVAPLAQQAAAVEANRAQKLQALQLQAREVLDKLDEQMQVPLNYIISYNNYIVLMRGASRSWRLRRCGCDILLFSIN